MKHALLFLAMLLTIGTRATAQTTCNAAGNMAIFSNYDGGKLNINVDVNVPNLVIGVVSYEADSVIISGQFASNVTAIRYAGYNSTNNNNCTPNIPTTVIVGAPATATTSIVLMPPSTVTNSNGYGTIICGYSCSITTNQGGCNTADQIAGYFQSQFPAASIRFHKIQYNCWSGTQTISGAGNCCAGVTTGPPPSTLAVNASATNILCNGQCTATLSVQATGGTPQYSYSWLNGGPLTATWTNRCPGTYIVAVTDAAATVRYDTVVVAQPAAIATTISQTACSTYNFNGTALTAAGQYKDTLGAANGCDSVITLNLTFTPVNINVNQNGASLTAAATPATSSYQWLRCLTSTSYSVVAGANAQTYTPAASGQYAVRVTQSGCADTSTCRSVLVTGVDDVAADASVRAYPNPLSGDHFTIEAPKALAGAAFTLTDAAGHIVKEGLLRGSKTDVRVTGLARGMYLLRIVGIGGAVHLVR